MIRATIITFYGKEIKLHENELAGSPSASETQIMLSNSFRQDVTNIRVRGADGTYHVIPFHNIARIDIWET